MEDCFCCRLRKKCSFYPNEVFDCVCGDFSSAWSVGMFRVCIFSERDNVKELPKFLQGYGVVFVLAVHYPDK